MGGVRREQRDLAACSPLMAHWLLLRHRATDDVRGGSSAREHHGVQVTPVGQRSSVREEALIASGRPTMKDARRESTRRSEHIVASYNRHMAEMSQEAHTARLHKKIQMAALKSAESRAIDRSAGPAAMRGYANFLVGLKRLELEGESSDVISS
uniref:Uncharacterized protein n=1 Tax=Haptolina brevifila TaxID=156173 RepID=A0A7S2I510_9EUKA